MAEGSIKLEMEGEEDEPVDSEVNSTEEEEEEEEEEDWCFVCKDGGDLILCDHKNCRKAYHSRCVRKSRASLNSEEDHWECAWHSCYNCKTPSNLRCYFCPKSVCNSCMDTEYFFRIKGRYGFCNNCRDRVLDIESIDLDDLSKRQLHFKEYYELVIKREGFDLNNLLSVNNLEMEKAHKPTFKNNDLDIRAVSKNSDEDKGCGGLNKRKIDYVDVSDEDDVELQRGPETSYAAIIAENIRLVYLTKSLVLELLKQPESFERKVEGSFVCVKSDLVNGGECQSTKSYQLVQVVGVTKEDSNGTSTVKLQLLNVPCDVSIDLLSEGQFSEEECEVLRKNVEDGLLNKPTVEELEHKARDLHRDLTGYMIAKELKTLPDLIDRANEKGWRLKLMEYLERKERLENESEVKRMMDTFPKVIAAEVVSNVVEPVAINTMDDDKKRKRSRSLPKSHQTSIDLEDAYKMKSSSVPVNSKLQGIKGTLASDTGCVAGIKGTSLPFLQENKSPSGIIKDTFASDTGCVVEDDVIIQEPFSHPIELQCNKTTSEKTSPKNSISSNSSLGDKALCRMLDGLVKPSNVVNRAFVSVPSKAIDHIEKGCILSLKEIPFSNYKEVMIPLANGFFATLRSLNIDYTRLYGHVKEYIRSSARLAQINNSKNRPSVEELNAKYESRKSCYEKCSEAFNEISKSLHTESELSQGRSEHASRLSRMVELSEEMEKSKKEMLQALDALDDRRKIWLEEEKVKEDFSTAKAALDW